MTCPICEKNLEVYEKKVNTEDNQTIVNKYAVCRDCKKQWPLKKRDPEPDESTTSLSDDSDDSFDGSDALADTSKSSSKSKDRKSSPDSKSRKKPGSKSDDYSKKKPKRNESRAAYAKGSPSSKHQKGGKKNTSKAKRPVFRILRITLGLLSLIAFGYLAFQTVLAYRDTITVDLPISQAVAYVVVATCALASGIILLATAKGNSSGAYVLPAIVYLAGGGYAFIYRGDSIVLLACSIAAVVLFVFLIFLSVKAKRRVRSSRR